MPSPLHLVLLSAAAVAPVQLLAGLALARLGRRGQPHAETRPVLDCWLLGLGTLALALSGPVLLHTTAELADRAVRPLLRPGPAGAVMELWPPPLWGPPTGDLPMLGAAWMAVLWWLTALPLLSGALVQLALQRPGSDQPLQGARGVGLALVGVLPGLVVLVSVLDLAGQLPITLPGPQLAPLLGIGPALPVLALLLATLGRRVARSWRTGLGRAQPPGFAQRAPGSLWLSLAPVSAALCALMPALLLVRTLLQPVGSHSIRLRASWFERISTNIFEVLVLARLGLAGLFLLCLGLAVVLCLRRRRRPRAWSLVPLLLGVVWLAGAHTPQRLLRTRMADTRPVPGRPELDRLPFLASLPEALPCPHEDALYPGFDDRAEALRLWVDRDEQPGPLPQPTPVEVDLGQRMTGETITLPVRDYRPLVRYRRDAPSLALRHLFTQHAPPGLPPLQIVGVCGLLLRDAARLIEEQQPQSWQQLVDEQAAAAAARKVR